MDTNGATHKKQQESLSPDGKVQILENDAAENKKQWKSLSPEQKSQVLTIDAAAHKKQYEFASPGEKSETHETKAEQRHEYLTEEQKKISAKIRSVAATLYEKVDLDKPTVEFLCEHFYKYPTLALVYYYCCLTDPRVAVFNDELKPDIDTSVIQDCISNLIGSPIGQDKVMLCQKTFNNLDQSHTRIAACASCRKCLLNVDDHQGIVEMKIDNLLSEFLLTESQIERLTKLPHDIV